MKAACVALVVVAGLFTAQPAQAEGCEGFMFDYSDYPDRNRNMMLGDDFDPYAAALEQRFWAGMWFDLSGYPGNCPNSARRIHWATRMLSASSNPDQWDGRGMDGCDILSALGKAIGAVFVVSYASEESGGTLKELRESVNFLEAALPTLYHGTTVTRTQCPTPPGLGKATASHHKGALTLYPHWLAIEGPDMRGAVIVHEAFHSAPRGGSHKGDCVTQDSRRMPYKCGKAWSRNGRCDAYQCEAQWESEKIMEGSYFEWAQAREDAMGTPTRWTQPAKATLWKRIDDVLKTKFEVRTCLTVLRMPRSSFGEIAEDSDCTYADFVDYETVTNCNDDVPRCASQPEGGVSTEPEPEPDPCDDARNWSRRESKDGGCSALVCEGLNETEIDWDSEECDPKTCKIQGCDVEYPYEEECPLGCFTSEASCQTWEPDPCVCLERCNVIARDQWPKRCKEIEQDASWCT